MKKKREWFNAKTRKDDILSKRARGPSVNFSVETRRDRTDRIDFMNRVDDFCESVKCTKETPLIFGPSSDTVRRRYRSDDIRKATVLAISEGYTLLREHAGQEAYVSGLHNLLVRGDKDETHPLEPSDVERNSTIEDEFFNSAKEILDTLGDDYDGANHVKKEVKDETQK